MNGLSGLPSAEYTLYIDESETYNSAGNKYFVMSGVIIRDSDYLEIENKLNQIKKKIWDNAPGCEKNILHEKDVGFANFRLNSKRLSDIQACYHVFRDKNKVLLLYNELSKLFKNAPLYTIGVCEDKTVLFARYGEDKLNNQLAIAIQLLTEHYCQFLIMNKATGAICYEAMQPEQNAKIQQRIYELKALGTLYYSPRTIQNYLHDIYFVPKSENVTGLQLADFVPNTLGRYAAMMKPKNRDFSRSVRDKLYNGNGDKRFGFKILA